MRSIQQLLNLVTNEPHPVPYLLADGIELWSNSQQFFPDWSQFPSHLEHSMKDTVTSQLTIG